MFHHTFCYNRPAIPSKMNTSCSYVIAEILLKVVKITTQLHDKKDRLSRITIFLYETLLLSTNYNLRLINLCNCWSENKILHMQWLFYMCLSEWTVVSRCTYSVKVPINHCAWHLFIYLFIYLFIKKTVMKYKRVVIFWQYYRQQLCKD
jgi:hypothetical protein